MARYCIPSIFLSRPTLTNDVVPLIVSERCGVALIKDRFHKFHVVEPLNFWEC